MKIKFLLLFFVLSLQALKAQPFTLVELKNFNEWSADKIDTYLVERGFNGYTSEKKDVENYSCIYYTKDSQNTYYFSACEVKNIGFDKEIFYVTSVRSEYLNIKKEITNSKFLFKEIHDVDNYKYFVYENENFEILINSSTYEMKDTFTILIRRKLIQ